MEITIQNIKRIGATNLIILSLVACSSTPAPWTQEDESPWGAKREAEASAVSASALSDTSLNDPVLLADPEPEPIVMQEPEAAPAPEVIAPVVVEDEPSSQDIMAMLSSNYAVQVFAAKNIESIEKFKVNKDVSELTTVKTDRSGEIMYVLVDIYPDKASADAAAVELENKTGAKPWVRSLAGLQKIAVH